MRYEPAFEAGREAYRVGLAKCPMQNIKWSAIINHEKDWVKRTWMAEDYCAGWEYEQNLPENMK